MEEKPSKREQRKERRRLWFARMRSKSRLVIVDEQTFAEKFSLRLSPMNLFIWVGSITFVLVVLTTMVIAYTPLREFIPGYPDGSERQAMVDNKIKADSLELELRKYDDYLRNVAIILNGGTIKDTAMESQAPGDYDDVDFSKSPEDSIMRRKVEEEERYALQSGNTVVAKSSDEMYGVFFFTPLEGTITQSFNPSQGHYGIDIVSPPKEAIKSTLDGTVVFADWTSDGGHEIHIQHSNNLISVYKHNAVLLKKTGDRVRAGDPIAIVGNTGKLSEGPHLHFELWHKGKAIDPQNYLIL
jgi:murein DD-endopeptidase MepM/ murein hydrolase activator NlpD